MSRSKLIASGTHGITIIYYVDIIDNDSTIL